MSFVENAPYLSNDSVRADRVVQATENTIPPTKLDVNSLGPRISAESAIVVDAKSGAVLYGKKDTAVWPMASIVKLMTALVFLETEPVLDARVEMNDEDERKGGEDYIRPGETATLRDVLTASLLGSANNATILLSRSAGMTTEEFVNRMNEKASELGMKSTKFVEPSGLSPENVSTAHDIVRLLSATGASELIADITGIHQDTIRVFPSGLSRRVITTNHLLGTIVFVEYGKTGYLDESLYSLAASVSTRQGNELYIVLLGSESDADRVQDAKNLTVWSQKVYQWDEL
jgi:D-alanyl-D-alanine carboxypeptidase